MHEGAIVHSLLDIAQEIKEKEKLNEISKVKIVVGKFHQIVEEVMMTQFNFMKLEYPGFENSELLMQMVDVKAKCNDCNHEFAIDEPIFLCPKCESMDTDLVTGKELFIETMEGTQI